ncbi:gfo/Idh/MocA family oxidoreductase [Paenibacillus sp. LMG 31459]|uniref:Gfo/Idh/MocA family oxidoreductase n=1 Tax=Paenibacillus phytohabitans TaxID=2654978 RepID=A0ABX1Y9P3_9BACL|nr:Gfo/Idh/MocA family oxidoreductase [Paenibacillus phytohabitans]NOU77653.1 gfo/Idh/MocA family oxidoreductase [Paenibacillus phytohabitans]
MNIGILGTGFGAYHASLLKQMECIDRVVVFGRNEAKLLKLKEELGVEITMSIEDIMSDPTIDIVDICLPSALHKTYAVEALRSGKHVFSETPVAQKLEDAQEMLLAEQQYGRRILVNQFIKFDYAYEYLYKTVQDATYGKLLQVTLRRETAPLWGDLGLSAIAANLMIHELDFIDWLLDSPAPSAVWGTSGGKDGQALVHASFLQPEVSAQLIVSSQMPDSYPFTVSYEAYFEQAKLVFHEVSYANGDIEASLTVYSSEGQENIPLPPNNPYEKSLRHALQCLQDGTDSILSIQHALKSLEIAFMLTDQLKGANCDSNVVALN